MCTLMSTRARTIVSFVLASASYPRLFILGALCSHLGTLPNQRDAIFAVAFQLTCEYRSTLVMAHSSNDVIALNLYREQRRKNSRKRQLPVLPIIFRTWLEEIDRSPRPFLKSCPRNLNTQRMARMFFFSFFFFINVICHRLIFVNCKNIRQVYPLEISSIFSLSGSLKQFSPRVENKVNEEVQIAGKREIKVIF